MIQAATKAWFSGLPLAELASGKATAACAAIVRLTSRHDLVTMTEAASVLGVSVATVRRHLGLSGTARRFADREELRLLRDAGRLAKNTSRVSLFASSSLYVMVGTIQKAELTEVAQLFMVAEGDLATRAKLELEKLRQEDGEIDIEALLEEGKRLADRVGGLLGSPSGMTSPVSDSPVNDGESSLVFVDFSAKKTKGDRQ